MENIRVQSKDGAISFVLKNAVRVDEINGITFIRVTNTDLGVHTYHAVKGNIWLGSKNSQGRNPYTDAIGVNRPSAP